jgi:hypothetical protein
MRLTSNSYRHQQQEEGTHNCIIQDLRLPAGYDNFGTKHRKQIVTNIDYYMHGVANIEVLVFVIVTTNLNSWFSMIHEHFITAHLDHLKRSISTQLNMKMEQLMRRSESKYRGTRTTQASMLCNLIS